MRTYLLVFITAIIMFVYVFSRPKVIKLETFVDKKKLLDDYYFEDKMECQPKCRWVCENLFVSRIVTQYVCLPCKNTCPQVVSPKCKTKCAKPDCIVECKKGCVKNNCPQCITKCKPSKCIVECNDPKVPELQTDCQNPCSWTCRKPECQNKM